MSLNLDFIKQYADHPQGLEDVYQAALEASMDLPDDYMFIEAGTRAGGSALAILQAINDSGSQRWLITLDPYGDKPYKVGDEVVTLDYGENHYRTAMKVLSEYSFDNSLNHAHFRMKSLDWMKTFESNEYWYSGEKMQPKFGFAYLDGDHDSDTVNAEYAWLSKKTPETQVVVDDAHYLRKETLALGEVKLDRLFIKKAEENAG